MQQKDLVELLENPSETLDRALKHPNYSANLIELYQECPEDGFNDSYVDEPAKFLIYCICKASNIQPSVTIEEAIADIEKNADDTEFNKCLNKYHQPNWDRKGETYVEFLTHDNKLDNAEKLISEGFSVYEIVITGDDSGDELSNPLSFVTEAADFARICNAEELAEKLENNVKVKEAEMLTKLICIL